MPRRAVRTEWESENISSAKQQSDDVEWAWQEPPSLWFKVLRFDITPRRTPAANAHIGKRTAKPQYEFVICIISIPHGAGLFAVDSCSHKFDRATEGLLRYCDVTSEPFLDSRFVVTGEVPQSTCMDGEQLALLDDYASSPTILPDAVSFG